MTSLTLEEWQQWVPPFEAAFQAHMAAWRLDGKPRTARRYTTYQNCPLPTAEDRLLLILVYLKTYPLQVVHGRLLGMGQSTAHQWIHALLPILCARLRTWGDAPTRSLTALAQRLGVAEADAAARVVPAEGSPPPAAPPPAALAPEPTSPLLGTTERNGASSVPRIRVRIEHVNRVKRCWIVHATRRLRKAGGRALVMQVGCGLHNLRVRLTPWQPMVESA